MNVQPIDRANLVPLPTPDARASASQARETLVQQVAALARQLADVMLAKVQNTASLNFTAARAVFAHAHIPTPKGLEQRSDTWRQSWRTFEVCATSADQVIQLTRGHVERTTAALWRVTERLVDEAAQAQQERLSDVRSAFAAMHEAQAAYWQATQQVHRELVALVQAPLVPPSTEVAHGAH
jgi:hypothetical protein